MEHCSVVLVDRANLREHRFSSFVDAGDWLMRRYEFGSLRLLQSTAGTWELWVTKGETGRLLYQGIRGGGRTKTEILSQSILRLLQDTCDRLEFDLRIFRAYATAIEREREWVSDNGL